MEFDILGELLLECLKFRDSGFSSDITLRDETTLSDTTGKELFTKENDRFFMRPESIPGDLSIKAIAVDAEGLYIETSPIDIVATEEMITEEMLPIRVDTKCFRDIHTNQELVFFSDIEKIDDLDERILITIYLKDLSEKRLNYSIQLIDLLYNKGCFKSEEESSIPISQVLELRVSLSLQTKMLTEQRPVLSLKVRTQVKTELRTELRMLFSLERQILSMGEEELLGFISEYVSKHGEVRIKNILLFTLAGKIKKVVPKLSWKDARHLARKMSSGEKVA